MNNISRIEICGNIASGKTTLAKGFTGCGLPSVKEDFHRNPFIEAFYKNPELFSFETEISFLLQHYHSIKCTVHETSFVCDFSLALDKAYADVTLPEKRRKIFLQITEELEYEIGLPSKIIHLRCPEDVLLYRIRDRNRLFEATIDNGYLKALNGAIEHRMAEASQHIDVLTVDSHATNFISGVADIPILATLCL